MGFFEQYSTIESEMLSRVTKLTLEWNTIRPKILYHYTNRKGLEGILKSGCVWATDYHYLNDRTEHSYGSNLLQRFLSHFSGRKSNYYRDILAAARGRLNEFVTDVPSSDLYSRYVASFCAKGDLLSLWRGYGDNGKGYSIGFISDDLRRTGFNLSRMRYKSKKKLLHSAFNSCIDPWGRIEDWADVSEENIRLLGQRVANFCFGVASLCKHKGFRDEREWRLYLDVLEGSDLRVNVKYRNSDDKQIPYLESGRELNLSIAKIIVGPRQSDQEFEESKELIVSLLKGYDVDEDHMPVIRRSKLPFV